VVTTESTGYTERGGGEGGGEERGTHPFFGELSVKVPHIGVISLGGRNEFGSVASADNAVKVQNGQEIGLLQFVGIGGA
jgi:hypothetical protein